MTRIIRSCPLCGIVRPILECKGDQARLRCPECGYCADQYRDDIVSVIEDWNGNDGITDDYAEELKEGSE